MKRLVIDILFFASMPLLPWWFDVALILVLCFYFEFYIEALFGGLMIDALFAVKTPFFRDSTLVMTYMTVVIFVVVTFVKQRIRLIRNG